MLKCSRCFGDSGHRLAVERKVPPMNRIGNEHFVAASAPRLAATVGSRVSWPQTCLAMAERDRCGRSRRFRRGHVRSFQSPVSFVRIEDVGYRTTGYSKSSAAAGESPPRPRLGAVRSKPGTETGTEISKSNLSQP